MEERDKILHDIDRQQAYFSSEILPRLDDIIDNKPLEFELSSDESSRKRKRQYLSEDAKTILINWLSTRLHNPYPTREEKEELSHRTGLTVAQIQYWFVNARRRYLSHSE